MSSSLEPFLDPELLAIFTAPGVEAPERPHPGAPAPVPVLDDHGVGNRNAMEEAAQIMQGGADLGHPGYFAHMDPPTPSIAQIGALLAAATNQNLLHHDTGPTAQLVEAAVVDWFSPFVGMSGGHMVPGSSLANLTALWAARELRGVTRVVASAHAHLSIRKGANILGLDFEELPTARDHRLTAVPADLSDAALVLTAGTTAVGAVDDLAIGSPAWRHVDAAWAGPLRLSEQHRSLLEGIEAADSVAVSAHKWLYQPKESAFVLFAEDQAAHEALSFGGSYLAAPNVGLQGSHGFMALPLYLTVRAWGTIGLARRIDEDMGRAFRLAELVADHPELELWGPPRVGVVNWRPRGPDPTAVRAAMTDGFVSLTTIAGEVWFRSVAANPFADADVVVNSALAAVERVDHPAG